VHEALSTGVNETHTNKHLEALIEEVVREDLTDYKLEDLGRAWELSDEFPEIKQIYGDYLSPFYLLFKGSMEPNECGIFFTPMHPRAHHDTNGYLRSKIFAREVGYEYVKKKISEVRALLEDGIITLKEGVRVRDDGDTYTIYTAYHNGYIANVHAKKIIALLKDGVRLSEILKMFNYDVDVTKKFLVRLVLLDIAQVR